MKLPHKFNFLTRRIIPLFFWKIDFSNAGTYSREMFLAYDVYRANYYGYIEAGWGIHHLSDYAGIITVWYFKAD
jgi:hypothetical protein